MTLTEAVTILRNMGIYFPAMMPIERAPACATQLLATQANLIYVGQTSLLLQTHNDRILPVTKQSRGLVPGGVTVSDESFNETVPHLSGSAETITIAHLLPHLDKAPIADLTIYPATFDTRVVTQLHDALTSALTPTSHRLATHCRLITTDYVKHTHALIGAGSGSTPSGDDMLTGILAATYALPDPDTRRALTPVIQGFLPRTTRISRHQLKAALGGEFASAHLKLITHMSAGDSRIAIELAQSIGHTSGTDFLTGLTTHILTHLPKEDSCLTAC